MDKKFREFVRDTAINANYKCVLVTFEYKHRSDYVSDSTSENAAEKIDFSVRKFRQKVLPELGQKSFPNRLRIKSRSQFGWDRVEVEESMSAEDYSVWLDNAPTSESKEAIELLQSCRQLDYGMLPSEDPTFIVIGDSHECVDELKQLIDIATKKFLHARVVHVGDYLDKGNNTKAMIEFMYSRIGCGDIILKANHENYIAGRLRNTITPNPELEEQYFTSLAILLKDEDLAKKFITIFECSKPFAILCDYAPSGSMPVIVTHAPCDNKYLGKVHGYSLTEQRNYRVKNKNIPLQEELSWFYDQADRMHPLHIFGHFAHKISDKRNLKFENKVFLDTGCVYGNELTAVVIRNGRILEIMSVKSTKPPVEGLEVNLGVGPEKVKPFDIKDYDLSVQDLRLIKQVKKNNVRYISGTMAPAPSSDTEIEPLEKAFEWFLKDGVDKVILEPKFMGSRCQVYLFKSGPENTFATSRRGWKIRSLENATPEEYQTFLESVWNEHKSLVEEHGDMILDGELMPWYSLGKDLIEREFQPYGELVFNELGLLRNDKGLLGLTNFEPSLQLNERLEGGVRYLKALVEYANVGKPEFKAFDVLWTSKGELENFSHLVKWAVLNLEPITVVDLKNELSRRQAANFFKELTVSKKMEGVVVKPLVPAKDTEGNEKSGIPYMKVRSEDYLHLVYGYDYLLSDKYQALVRQKKVGSKVSLSIKEYELGMRMLVSPEDRREEFAVKLTCEINREVGLDPRL